MLRRCSALIALPALLTAGCGGDGTSQETFPLCAADPGPAPLRRITRFEYGRTISDLTGVPASVADQLPPDEETLGFDDIADAYSVSSLHAARYLDVAEQAAAALTANAARLTAVAGCDPTAGDAACVGSFIAGFGRRAWRRPLDARRAGRRCSSSTPTPPSRARPTASRASWRRCCSRRSSSTGPSRRSTRAARDHRAAGAVRAGDAAVVPADGRRARTTRCSPPSRRGALDTEDGLLAQTDRLLAGPRAAELFVHVAQQWWELGNVPALDKDRSLYRTWTDATRGRPRRGDAPVPRRRLAGHARTSRRC